MKWFMTWQFLFMKRLLKAWSFWLVLLLPFLITIGMNQLNKTQREQVNIGIVWDDKSELSQNAGEYLIEKDEYFKFDRYETKDSLLMAVTSQEIECGYILPVDIENKLDTGESRSMISCIDSPSTMLSKLTDEMVFSAIFRYYGGKMAKQYTSELLKKGDAEKLDIEEMVLKGYENILNSNATFSFKYETIDAENDLQKNSSGEISLERGLNAVLLLAAGFLGIIRWYSDKKRGLFASLTSRQRFASLQISILAPVLLLDVAVLSSRLFAEGVTPSVFLMELICLIFYTVGLLGMSNLLVFFTKNELDVCSVLPVFVLGSFVFCPIFFKLSDIILLFRFVEKLFLPYYYLEAVAGGSLLMLMIVSIGLILGGMGLEFLKYEKKRMIDNVDRSV